MKIIQKFFKDERGCLTLFEALPSIKRFWISDGKLGTVRGKHGHFRASIWIIPLDCKLKTLEYFAGTKSGTELGKHELHCFHPKTWHAFEYLEAGQVLCFSDSDYDPKDYFYDRYKI